MATSWTNSSSARVSYVTLFRAPRSLADGDGQPRTSRGSAAQPWLAGDGLRLADPGYTVDAGANRLCRRCQVDCPGTGSIKSALPAWMRNRRITCGAVPRQLAPSHGHRSYTCGCPIGTSRGRLFRSHHQGQCRPTNRTDLVRESSPAWFPPPGRSITMDNRLCRSVRRSEPGGRCGAAAGRLGHVRR